MIDIFSYSEKEITDSKLIKSIFISCHDIYELYNQFLLKSFVINYKSINGDYYE